MKRPNVEAIFVEIEVIREQQRCIAGNTDATDTDEALARLIATGDTDAWDRFFDRYSSWVFRFAYRHLNANRAKECFGTGSRSRSDRNGDQSSFLLFQ